MENTEQRKTSAEIKAEIEAASKASKAKTDLKESAIPLTGQIAAQIAASDISTPEPTSKTESKPDPTKSAAETAAAPSKESVDLQEWAKKKGINWTTENDVLAALHKSDQQFHRKREEDKSREATINPGGQPPRYIPPQPTYQPPAQMAPYPAYGQAPASPRQVIENMARDFNMLPEDVERLAKFNYVQFQTMLDQQRQLDRQKWEQIERDNQKNSVFRELSLDPVFRRPDVAMEYFSVVERIQESDPQSFEQDPNQYKRAFEMALANIGRRNLEGRPLHEGVPPSSIAMTPPTTPPRPLGQGSGGGAYENENAIDPNAFAKLSVEDKRKFLESRGLISTY